MELPIYQVDAFTARAFGGNPAAVCPLETWLSEESMQALAMENNLSETAYLLEREGQPDGVPLYDLRWFTPAVEVDLCGHATLASAFVVFERLKPSAREVRFETKSGRLIVTREGDWLKMDLPTRQPQPCPGEKAAFEAAVSGLVLEAWRGVKNIALLESQEAVIAAAPDLSKIMDLPGDGLIVTAKGEDCDFVSRYFAPQGGIDEDPVTGSAHCELAPFWAERLGKTQFEARQVSARGGVLRCDLAGDRTFLSGQAVLVLEGKIYL